MPYVSDAQRRFFNANRKQLASQGVDVDEWNQASKGKKLPERVNHKEASSMSIATLAAKTAAQTQVIKFAREMQTSPACIEKLAADLNIEPATLVKRAYADPLDFLHVTQIAAGVPITGRLKKAGMGADMLKAVMAKLKSAGGAIDKNVLQKVIGNSKSWNDTVGKRSAVAGGAGLAGAGVAAGVPAAASAISSGVDKLKSGVNSVVQEVGNKATELKDAVQPQIENAAKAVQPHLENAGKTIQDTASAAGNAIESTAIDMLPTRTKIQVMGDLAKRPAILGAGLGAGMGALGGGFNLNGAGGGGTNALRGGVGGLLHGGLVGAGAGAGAGAGMFLGNAYGGNSTARGIGALAGGALGGLAGHAIGSPLDKAVSGEKEEEKMKPKWASDLDFVKAAMVRAIQTKQAQLQRTAFVYHLDKVASHMSLEKQASVRVMQAAIAQGKPLSHAIKLAYPQLNGEQRGILASDMVNNVVAAMQKAATGMGIPTVEPKSYTVPMKDAGKTMATACS